MILYSRIKSVLRVGKEEITKYKPERVSSWYTYQIKVRAKVLK